jgi:soluble lytic murein transglycosylase-like protein
MLLRFVLMALLALCAVPAAADEALARRIAALRAVVEPLGARVAGSPQIRAALAEVGSSSCTGRELPREISRERTDIAIRDASIRFGVDPRLIRSVIRHESNYDPKAVSSRGAMGLMQLMPGTARELGVTCAFDPRQNVLGGSRYLRRMRDELGSWPRALAAYHAGPTRVRSGRLPRETRRYVARVLASWGRAGAPALELKAPR